MPAMDAPRDSPRDSLGRTLAGWCLVLGLLAIAPWAGLVLDVVLRQDLYHLLASWILVAGIPLSVASLALGHWWRRRRGRGTPRASDGATVTGAGLTLAWLALPLHLFALWLMATAPST